ncbi:hypothetical protein OH77DRAFT_1431560 [Trametes cingulata]|nr:hypothetical protein OH77DRAFT_1431560 [Trametes cingulata]
MNRYPSIRGGSASAHSSPRRAVRGVLHLASLNGPFSRSLSRPIRSEPGMGRSRDVSVPLPPTRSHSPVTPAVRSTAYWGEEAGDVVVQAGQAAYRLPTSSLREHCEFFARAFAIAETAGRSESDSLRRIDGCAVYEVPRTVTPAAFELLLGVLGIGGTTRDVRLLSTAEAATLLRVSTTLSCEEVARRARERLAILWDGRRLPRAESYRTANVASAAHSLSTNHEAPASYSDALVAIRVAREFNLPSVLKRAAYELVASDDFWMALRKDPVGIDVSGADMLRLVRARRELRKNWHKAVSTPPMNARLGGRVESVCHWLSRTGLLGCKRRAGPKRSSAWHTLVESSKQAAKGECDPMRYDVFRRLGETALQPWCTCCIRQWERTLLEKRTEWWARLDHILQ